jgi:plastocyanin
VAVAFLAGGCESYSTPPEKAANVTPVDRATAGTIDVHVKYQGPAPKPVQLSMRSAPACAEMHPEPVYDQSLVVADGNLVNAVVWIKSGFGERAFSVPQEPVVIDQKGCIYVPHVAAAMVNQEVRFVNSDPELHNVRGRPEVVRSWNFSMGRQGATRKMYFDQAEIAIAVGCDIHPWMRAHLAVVDNPYFAVTPASGAVQLSAVPPGDYVVASWHETLGVREQNVSLGPRGSASAEFVYAAGD